MPSNAISIDAPVEGWNAFDSLDNMPPTAAIVLDNLIPGAGRVTTRPGSFEYVDLGTGVPCETVASFDSATESKLIAASGGGVWDITDTEVEVKAGAAEELAAPGTFSSDRWQTTNFRKADETGVLVMCNGVDSTQIFTPSTPGTLEDMIYTPETDTWVDSWNRIADSDVTTPADGEWNTNVAQTLLRIAWLDDTGETRQAALQGESGSVFIFKDDLDSANFTEFTTSGTYTEQTGYTEYTGTVTETGGTGATVGELQNVEGAVVRQNESDFIGCEVFKGRVYYWKDDDDAFYYTAAGSYQGELFRFPLGAFVQKGGKLVQTVTWTQKDSGDGRDDFIVFVFSTGEILVYQGDDPGGVGFFEMVGRYNTAPPLSTRGTDKYGSDIIIMTTDGYVGLSSVIQEGRTSDVPAFSRLIHNAIIKQTRIRRNLYGWDCTLFAEAGLFVFNVPLSDDSFVQHVYNTVTQRWCRFRNMNINCLETHQARLFGGTQDGRVLALLEGTSDEDAPIQFSCLYAFNTMGEPGNNKHLMAAQILTTHGEPGLIEMSGFADFKVPVISPIAVPPVELQATWSVNPAQPAQAVGSYWDEDYWAVSNEVTTKGWQNVSAYGYSVALLVRFAKVNSQVAWRSTNLRYNTAGAQ